MNLIAGRLVLTLTERGNGTKKVCQWSKTNAD